jgi:zinc protease
VASRPRPFRRWTLAVAGAALLALAPGAAEARDLAAHRETLPNGAVLLVAERPQLPIVFVRLSLPAGAVFDPREAPGLASLTAELLTRGTARRSAAALDEAIEFVGGSLEARAGRDVATLSLAVLRKDLGLGLDLLFEALREPAFPADELERKVKELQGAIRRSEESPENVAGRALAELLYAAHPYGRPPEGTVEGLGRLTREQVVAFHRERYRPAGAVVVVAGDVRADEIRQELGRRMAGWGGTPPGPPPARAPAAAPARARTIRRELTQATVLLGRPAVGHAHPDYYPLVVANYLLGGSAASRLYVRVREERGLAYDVGSHLAVGRHGATLVVSLQTRPEALAEGLSLVREEMARLGREAVPEAELARARAYLVGSFLLRMDSTAKAAALLQAVEEFGLGLDYPARYRRAIERVTPADLLRVARRYLDPAAFSSVTLRR